MRIQCLTPCPRSVKGHVNGHCPLTSAAAACQIAPNFRPVGSSPAPPSRRPPSSTAPKPPSCFPCFAPLEICSLDSPPLRTDRILHEKKRPGRLLFRPFDGLSHWDIGVSQIVTLHCPVSSGRISAADFRCWPLIFLRRFGRFRTRLPFLTQPPKTGSRLQRHPDRSAELFSGVPGVPALSRPVRRPRKAVPNWRANCPAGERIAQQASELPSIRNLRSMLARSSKSVR